MKHKSLGRFIHCLSLLFGGGCQHSLCGGDLASSNLIKCPRRRKPIITLGVAKRLKQVGFRLHCMTENLTYQLSLPIIRITDDGSVAISLYHYNDDKNLVVYLENNKKKRKKPKHATPGYSSMTEGWYSFQNHVVGSSSHLMLERSLTLKAM